MERPQVLQVLELEMGTIMRRMRRVMSERARMMDPPLNAGAYWIVHNIATSAPKRASTIAEEFGIDKGAVSRQVQELVELGYVERRPDPLDGRAQIIRLTDLGQRRFEEVNVTRRHQYAALFADWTVEDLEVLVAMMARYNTATTGLVPE